MKSKFYRADKGRLFRAINQDESGKIETAWITVNGGETSIVVDKDITCEISHAVPFDERNARFQQMYPNCTEITSDEFTAASEKALELIKQNLLASCKKSISE